MICMGSLKRNHDLLKDVITHCPFADFNICMGGKEYSYLFEETDNVNMHGYLPEDELLALMQQSDVSLSALYDTVGSNVIVTSMATGLVNVVSDVGSIRDYCSENDSFLCNDKKAFISALQKLNDNKNLLKELSANSIEKTRNLDLEKFLKVFPGLIE